MTELVYDADLNDNMWAKFCIHYYVEKVYRDEWQGLPYNVPPQIYIDKVEVLTVEGYDQDGNRLYRKQREDMDGWEIDLDNLCHAEVVEQVELWGRMADYLLENADA